MLEIVILITTQIYGSIHFGWRVMRMIVTMMTVTLLLRTAMVAVIMTMLRVRSDWAAHLTVYAVVRVQMVVVPASLPALLVAYHKLVSDQHESEAACKR